MRDIRRTGWNCAAGSGIMKKDILNTEDEHVRTECLRGEYVGIEQIEDDRSRLWYCNYELGTVDHRRWRVMPAKCRALLAGVNPSKQES